MSDFVPKVVGAELPPPANRGGGHRALSPKVAFALSLLKASPGAWVQLAEHPKKNPGGKDVDLLGPWKSLAKMGAKFAQRTVGETVRCAMLPAEEVQPPAMA